MIEILKAVILGIVEGITEWLPVSSTGHMILVNEWIGLNVTPAFEEIFLVVIQLGAILAVLLLYFERLNPFSKLKSGEQKRQTLSLWGKVIVASLPIVAIGLPFDDMLEEHFYNYQTVSVMLVIYGILFLIVERWNRTRTARIADCNMLPFQTALAIGAFQVLSLIPGTSRSGATILGAIILGVTRAAAAEFSFFLAIPIMFGASLLKLLKFGFHFTGMELAILFSGTAAALVVSLITIRMLVEFVRRHDFAPFGVYRIILGIAVLAYFGIAG